jgi:hypothetical protein
MRPVHDVILCFNLEERLGDDYNNTATCEPIESINAWLKQVHGGGLDELSKHVSSGGETMQGYVYGGAFYFMDVEAFVRAVFSQKWKKPEAVQLFIKDQEPNVFTIHTAKRIPV